MYLDGCRQQIIAWVAQGLSDRTIAERVRVSPSTVRYWCERNGVTRPPKQAASKRVKKEIVPYERTASH